MENKCNSFNFDFDIIDTSIEQFQNHISKFFKEKMDEFNFNISKFEFFDENKSFFDPNKKFHLLLRRNIRSQNFIFWLKIMLCTLIVNHFIMKMIMTIIMKK